MRRRLRPLILLLLLIAGGDGCGRSRPGSEATTSPAPAGPAGDAQDVCQRRACRPETTLTIPIDGDRVAELKLAPSPYLMDDGGLVVVPGDAVELSAVAEGDQVRVTGVAAAGEGSIQVVLSQMDNGATMLRVKHTYGRALAYCARIQILGVDGAAATSIVPVAPSTFGGELWEDPIVGVRLDRFELTDDRGARTCRRDR